MTEPNFSDRESVETDTRDASTQPTTGQSDSENARHADVYATADEPALDGETPEQRDERLYPPAPRA